MNLTAKKLVFVLCVAVGLFAGACGYIAETNPADPNTGHPQTSASPQPVPPSIHLPFGNPSKATTDVNDRDNYLLIGQTSAMSYNNSSGTANWISWKTTKEDLGDKLERPDFMPDQRLPKGFTKVTTFDYIGSGFDRGHMVPSADRFAKADENRQTFMMTNIVPQAGELNQFPWNKLESYARSQAWRGRDIYTIAGVYGEKGRLRGKVTVPTNCWKIIVILPHGSGIQDINERTRVIAVDMPNVNGIRNNWWETYRVSVRSIEQKTGYDFFDRLPRVLQEILENKIDGD